MSSSVADKLKSNNMVAQSIQSAESKNISIIMSDARYLRQSSALINDALQKGFDVMQLADGSVVISGMKVVSYQYEWDETKGKLIRSKSATQKNNVPVAKPRVNIEELNAEEELEENEFSN